MKSTKLSVLSVQQIILYPNYLKSDVILNTEIVKNFGFFYISRIFKHRLDYLLKLKKYSTTFLNFVPNRISFNVSHSMYLS